MVSWQEKIDADMPISARSSTHQMIISAKPLRGAVVLACKFVGDLANIDILAAIASCLQAKTPSRPGHVLYVNTP
jgi:hypothetical protein